MIYLYLGNNTIKLLSLSKTMLGQYNTSFFYKRHETTLLNEGKIENVDIVASAIKEALTNAKPEAVDEKAIFLILPQQAFSFARYDIPSDMSESAIHPFIEDKIRAEMKLDLSDFMYDLMVHIQKEDCAVNFYGLLKRDFDSYKEVFDLLNLVVKNIVPETVCYYKLFEKTLREEKKENIFYLSFCKEASFGYLFDNLGLLNEKRYVFKQDDRKEIAKKMKAIKDEGCEVNRIILSGERGDKVRQDLFTKEVGVWTNPIEKIVENFYKNYTKMLLPNNDTKLPLLTLDACLGGFIFNCERESFSLIQEKDDLSRRKKRNISLPTFPSLSRRDIIVFVVSFLVTFGLIFAIVKRDSLISLLSAQPTPTPTLVSTTPTPPLPSPTPSFTRDEIRVKVLNGSGIAGKAREIADVLREAGYTDVVTGNADTFDYEETVIAVSEDKKEAFDLIVKDMEDYFTKTSSTTLSQTESADVVITLGTDIE